MTILVDKIYTIPYERKLELVELLGISEQLYSTMVEIHKGMPENVTFVDYDSIDNNMDLHFRNYRNRVAAETLYNIIKNDEYKLSQVTIFLKS